MKNLFKRLLRRHDGNAHVGDHDGPRLVNEREQENVLLERPGLRDEILHEIGTDDGLFLRVAEKNKNRNNTLLSNFFAYRHSIGEWLDRADIGIPRSMLELGCGRIPWTGLRFLLDGTQRYLANDIMAVRETFPAQEIADLKELCVATAPSLLTRWSAVLGSGGSDTDVAPVGLDVRGGVGFETLALDSDFDFTLSTSVLEHVMDPDGVYRKLAEVIRPGGYMFHSIDLRDHRYFDTDDIAFLRDSDEQYARVNTENRLRASDHRDLIDAFGFERVQEKVLILQADGSAIWTMSPEDIRPFVTEADRERLNARFRRKDLRDLSTLAIQVLSRKRFPRAGGLLREPLP